MAAPIFRYTSAPEAYDGFGTFTVETTDYRDNSGRPFRKVEIPEDAQFNNWQVDRYGSGLYAAFSTEQFFESVRLGLIRH